MTVQCPNCGADVEFRFDDSMVRVCSHCNAAVMRTDRGVETLGKIADLAPLDSPLALFAEGKYFGRGFMLVGKAQIRHQAGGVWQEWYARFDDGRWGWIAEHQGRFTVTFEVPNLANVPPLDQLTVGGTLDVGAAVPYTITEVAQAVYLGAAGELPFVLRANTPFVFADLSDGAGAFATIDYGAPGTGEAPAFYAGKWVALADLHISGGERNLAPARATAGQKLACPECNGSLELRLPDSSLSVKCPFCDAVLACDPHGQAGLALLGKLPSRRKPAIPLGTKLKLPQGEFTLVGYMQRSAWAAGTWWPFAEYLLHAPQVGFRWLVCSDGHWSYGEPVDAGAVQVDVARNMTYNEVTFRGYAGNSLRVDEVYGEFYWQVKVGGPYTSAIDAIAPPAMLSREVDGQEVNYTLSTYLPLETVRRVSGVNLPDERRGVAPHQPRMLPHLGKIMLLFLGLLIAAGAFWGGRATNRVVTAQSYSFPPGKPPAPPLPAEMAATPLGQDDLPGNAFFTEPFAITGGKNVEIVVSATGLSNTWAYLVVDLFNEQTGQFYSLPFELEYYSGYDGGEYWSEGSTRRSKRLGPIPAGSYVARVEGVHGTSSDVGAFVTIRQDVFQFSNWVLAFVALLLVFGIPLLRRRYYEKKRMENAGFYTAPAAGAATPYAADDDDSDDDDTGFFGGDE